MSQDDIIRVSDLESIAQKVKALPKPMDIQAHALELSDKEWRIVLALEQVAKVSLFNEFKHIKDKINNHHHVSLSVNDGIAFRENGNRVKFPKESEAGQGTRRNERTV